MSIAIVSAKKRLKRATMVDELQQIIGGISSQADG